MRKCLLAVACVALGYVANAQQDPQFTLWMYDKLSFNPAAAGSEDCHCFTPMYRDQWDGFTRDPKTILFNYNGYINKDFGIGVTFYNDHLGQEINSVVRLSGAWRKQINAARLSIGLSLGMYGKKLGNDWVYIDPNDAIINEIENGKAQSTVDIGFGAMYAESGKYYLGLSATHLTGPEFADLNIKAAQHIYLMGGYTFPDITSSLDLRLNALAKTDLNATAFDINANVLYNDMFFGGLSFRPGDAIAPMVGIEYDMGSKPINSYKTLCVNKLKLGYSYDITMSEISNYSSGSHEFFVTYCFNICTIPVRHIHGDVRSL